MYTGRRLLMVTTIARTAEAFLVPFAIHFRRMGMEVDLAAAGASTCVECGRAFSRVFDIPWSRLPCSPTNVYACLALRRILIGNRYDLLHTHTPVASFLARVAVGMLPRTQRPKVVYTAHGFHFYRGGRWWHNIAFLILEKIAALWTDRLIVINHDDEYMAKGCKLVPVDKLRYVPGIGIDTEYYRPDAVSPTAVAQMRSALGLGPRDALFVMVAEFQPGKRHQDAVEALARLGRSAVHLAFVGTGPTLERIRAHVVRRGVEDRVHFLGFRNDVPILMRAATATLMPSEREGLNRSVMESLALEVPVIGSDARGVRDLLGDGCGLVVRVGDVDGLARAMAWVLDHPEEAREMARRGRERVLARHDIKLVLKLHEGIYEELLEEMSSAKLSDEACP